MAANDFSKRIYAIDVENHLNQSIFLCGWIKKMRKMGKLIFIDLRDGSGIVQLVVKNDLVDFVENKTKMTKESTIGVVGTVLKRKDPNRQLPTGNYEVNVSKIQVFSTAIGLPMLTDDQTDALENVRLKYRFLDLRRPCMQTMLKTRSTFIHAIRDFLINENFVEVETPYLTKPTPEGARDYVVPTRLSQNSFYALSQSPQLYKQLLMLSSLERYFQIARCFRDEDARSDRQPEHTQLDVEMAFVNGENVQDQIEKMVQFVTQKVFNVKLEIPFERINYFDALNWYGSDKPDLRYGFKLIDGEQCFGNLYKKKLNLANPVVKILFVPNYHVNDEFITIAKKCARDNNAILDWVSYDKQKLTTNLPDTLHSELNLDRCLRVCGETKSQLGVFFMVANNDSEIAAKALGSVRVALYDYYADKWEIFKDLDHQYKYCWVVNWPLFVMEDVLDLEKSSLTKKVYKKQIVSAHNPFTKPQLDTLKYLNSAPLKVMANSYDLVLNGKELGSGAVRNSEPQLQTQIFSMLGLSEDEIKKRFGFLLDAYKYGAPQHAGIGIGIDRWISVMLHLPSVKDVIAFPKTNQGIELLSGAPAPVDEAALKDVFISVLKK